VTPLFFGIFLAHKKVVSHCDVNGVDN